MRGQRSAVSRQRALPVLGQSVLLRGVNDSAEALEALFRAMLAARVKPYYLHQLDPAPGTARFHVPIEEGRRLLAQLRGRVTGLAWPTYVLDIPGGHGKVPIGPDYLEPDGVRDPAGNIRHAWLRCRLLGVTEFDVRVDLRQRQFDADLRHAQHVGLCENAHRPLVTVAGEHHGGDAVLFQDDIALNGRRCLIFAQLLDPVDPRGVGLSTSKTTTGAGTIVSPGRPCVQLTDASG